MDSTSINELLRHISPACSRDRWIRVGAAIKEEGGDFEMFDAWSAQDQRPEHGYAGEETTRRVWDSFNGSSDPVTGGTLYQFASEEGYSISRNKFLSFNDILDVDPDDFVPATIQRNDLRGIGKPNEQIQAYLDACFAPDDKVNIIVSSYMDKDGKYKPFGLGPMSITADEYKDRLRRYADEKRWFDMVFGSYDHEAGAWIRVNPTKGTLPEGAKGIRDEDIFSFENVLIECDDLSIDEQIARIKDLNLPYKALVYTGGKSVHAIVRIDAYNTADYKQRAKWLFDYCIKHGLPVDTQNANPSRMTRLPGVERGKNKQTLLEVQKPVPFDEWKTEAIARDEACRLEIDSIMNYSERPEMNPELIEGVLRTGHKMLISGPSKAGKSFALIGLAIAVSEGKKWMSYQCRNGRVLYLNLEVDKPSFINRVFDVYSAMGIDAEEANSFDVIHLRGECEPLDTLSRKLKWILSREHYDLVIVDPIYKVITGDENSASEMGKFCNLFDEMAKAGQCALAYCHHHSKGAQAGKSAMDRASGSGVFARDPDAILDLSPLEITDSDREEIQDALRELLNRRWLEKTGQWSNIERYHPEWVNDRVQKDLLVQEHIRQFPSEAERFMEDEAQTEDLGRCDAFRLSMALREFRSPNDIEVFFKHPLHIPDPTGLLSESFVKGDNRLEKMQKAKVEAESKRSDKRREWYDAQREAGNTVTISDMMNSGLPKTRSKNTVRKWVDEQEDLRRVNGIIMYANEPEPEIDA